MDEVENPALPAAGESSPTLGPIGQDEDASKPGIDTAEAEGLVDSANPSPVTRPVQPEPPAPSNPPPAPPAQPAETGEFPQDLPDSLTLADLKRIRSTFPNAQVPSKQQLSDTDKIYDFEYTDAQSLPAELEEWFSYSDQEEVRLRKCKAMFNQEWRASEHGGDSDWLDVSEDVRREFVKSEVEALRVSGGKSVTSLMMLVYVGLGIWEETAGRKESVKLEELFPEDAEKMGARLREYEACALQVQWIVGMVDTLHACNGLQVVYQVLQKAVDSSFASSPIETRDLRNETQPKRGEESMELWCCLTLMYLFVEVARTTSGTTGKPLKADVLALQPKLINYLTQMVAKLRWDEVAPLPLTKMLLLCWKTILVTFGGIQEVEHIKTSLRPTLSEQDEKDIRGQPIITASPLDYHLFRQEISSKYPAYQPPPPLFPLEPENNSILPPLKHRRPSYASSSAAGDAGGGIAGAGSIMHRPVHIATPAPSPPPSPAGPGKAGKKQNYQTNQMFPFLYPPLDAESGSLGGKGNTALQDALVGRKWEGSDVPASILEAAELFAKRMRATRGMKQLWEARVEFTCFERGWKADGAEAEAEDADVDDECELVPKPAEPGQETAPQGQALEETPEQKKLREVGEYYRGSLPHLQSLVIVLLKAVLQNVTDLVTKNNGANGLQAGIQFNDMNGNVPNGSAKPAENGINGHADGLESNTTEELDKLRTQEIAAKALSGILILLLKWFKVSHVLQYEYLTQLLLDSNYVPLVLKLWQAQDIGRACHYKLDREESNFFYFCQTNSRQGPPRAPNGDAMNGTQFEESEDEACPPPIRRNRHESARASDSSAISDSSQPISPTGVPGGPDSLPSAVQYPPEVDELGYPLTPLPLPGQPITNYSWRNLFSCITYLRILQKITRRKTHRALLLVSYKSSNHLKKSLKVPVRELRFWTLKLFKSQVPFCGRKWRQGNMKIITAVYLSVPPELRDDWLSGGGGGMGGSCVVGDVDGTVEDALPLEQSLRNLTHWWNVRHYPDVMGVDKGMLEEEMEFFGRELEKMEIRVEEELGVPEDGQMEGVGGDGGGGGWGGPIEGY